MLIWNYYQWMLCVKTRSRRCEIIQYVWCSERFVFKADFLISWGVDVFIKSIKNRVLYEISYSLDWYNYRHLITRFVLYFLFFLMSYKQYHSHLGLFDIPLSLYNRPVLAVLILKNRRVSNKLRIHWQTVKPQIWQFIKSCFDWIQVICKTSA